MTTSPADVPVTVPATTTPPTDPRSTDPVVTTPTPDSTTTTTTTTTTVATSAPLPPGLPIAKPLAAGTTYRIARSALGRSVQITNAVDGARGSSGRGGFVITADEIGFEPLIGGFDLSKVRLFADPLIDAYALPDDEAFIAATVEPPADFLAAFAALPGVEVGEVTDAEFAGRPARAMSRSFGAFEGGVPCGSLGSCVNVLWLPGYVSTYTTGDAGTLYALDLDGQTVLVEVQDRPGAQEMADSLVIGD